MDWDDYEPFDPGVEGPPSQQPRRVAKAAFERLMAAKSERIEQLRRLLAANGLNLSTHDEGIVALNKWFRDNITRDQSQRWIMDPMWYAVANDIALFLGDVLIERKPHLHWEFYTWGKSNVSYQRAVIMGFKDIPNNRYNIDANRLIVLYGIAVVEGTDSRLDVFTDVVNADPEAVVAKLKT